MTPSEHPNVTVIMPFAGSEAEAQLALAELAGLGVSPGDRRILVDNSPQPIAEPLNGVEVIRAPRIGSSYYARNVGAAASTSEWLLFVDSDCLLPAELLEEFFAEPVGERCAVVAGEIEGDPGQESLVPRYMRSRGHLHASGPLATGPTPAVGTANMLARRAAFEQLGSFREVVSGADFEFSWRAGAAGWEAGYRPRARVLHRHPDRLAEMRRKARRYGAGQRWLDRLHPGVPRHPGLAREVVRAAGGVAAWTLTGRFERAAFKALDAAWIEAYWRGWHAGDNRPAPLPVEGG